MSKLSVGDKVIVIKDCSENNFKKGEIGLITKVNYTNMPYRIEFEDGAIYWAYSSEVKLYDCNEQSLTKANLTQQTIKLLQASLEDELGIVKVTIEFDTGLVITLNEKE